MADREKIDNRERGCGFLKEEQAYVRADLGEGDGVLPPFVRCNPTVPHLEMSRMRSWKRFEGIPFELGMSSRVRFEPVNFDLDSATEKLVARGLYEDVEEVPNQEIHRHLDRLYGFEDGSHVGEMLSAKTHDMLMWVGKKHYPEPGDFIEEAAKRGLNKAIPTSKNQDPPTINPGSTRVWLVHPRGVHAPESSDRDFYPGIIGYSYLTRVIYTEPAENDRVPKYVQDWAATGKVDIVETGPEIPKAADSEDQTGMGDFLDEN